MLSVTFLFSVMRHHRRLLVKKSIVTLLSLTAVRIGGIYTVVETATLLINHIMLCIGSKHTFVLFFTYDLFSCNNK